MHTLRAVLLSLVAILAGCNTQPRPELSLDYRLHKAGFSQGEAVNAIRSFQISNWQYLDDEHIIIHSGKTAYLIRFIMPCGGISGANTLRYTGTPGLLTRMDKIYTGIMRCSVHEIYQLDSLDTSTTTTPEQ